MAQLSLKALQAVAALWVDGLHGVRLYIDIYYFFLISSLDGSNDFRLRAPSSAPMPLREPLGNEGEGFKDPDDDSSRGLDLPIPEVVDRNAQFYGLSIKQREHIRCVEYRAIRMLGYLIPGYIVFWQGLGCLVLGSYISSNQSSATRANEPNPW
jgi:hypothetical protein